MKNDNENEAIFLQKKEEKKMSNLTYNLTPKMIKYTSN